MSRRNRSFVLAASLVAGVALALPASASADAAALAQSLAGGDRPEADKARDAGRKPADVVAFLGIEEGMTVVDLIAAGGYYTEVLSVAVGPEGRVLAQNSAFVLQIREGANEKAMSARVASGRIPNVERLDREIAELGLAPGSIDAAVTALNFHDIYNGSSPEAADGFLQVVYAALRPGGVLGIVDHVGVEGADNKALHRIEEAKVRAAAQAVGFEIESSDLLHNTTDDHSQNVFAEGLRGKTDRFVLKLRKPSGS